MKPILKIIDANLNRSREGLRVCEDIARFFAEDKDAAQSLKTIRHSVTSVFIRSKITGLKKILLARDTERDCGKFSDFKKMRGTDITGIFMANIERAKESLRVLEECSKIIDETASQKYRKLRFDTYDVEKKFIKNHGSTEGRRH